MLPGGSRARVRRARRLDAFEGHALGLRHALGSRGHGLGLRGAVELVDQGRHLGVGRNGLAEPRQRRVGRRVAASRDLALGDRSLGRGELGLRRADLAVEGLGLVALGRQQQEPERRQRGDRDDHAQHHSVTGGHRESAPVATLVGAAPGLTKLSVSWKVTPRDFGQLAEAPAPVPAEGLGGGGATEEPGAPALASVPSVTSVTPLTSRRRGMSVARRSWLGAQPERLRVGATGALPAPSPSRRASRAIWPRPLLRAPV